MRQKKSRLPPNPYRFVVGIQRSEAEDPIMKDGDIQNEMDTFLREGKQGSIIRLDFKGNGEKPYFLLSGAAAQESAPATEMSDEVTKQYELWGTYGKRSLRKLGKRFVKTSDPMKATLYQVVHKPSGEFRGFFMRMSLDTSKKIST